MSRPGVSRWLLENRSNNWLMSWKRWATHSWRRLLISWDLTPGTSLTVASSVRQAETMGPEQYQTFMTDPLVERTTHIKEPIKKIKLSFFSRPPQREKSNTSLQVSSLKSDCSRFSRLYIVCQSRDGNLQDFFKHEKPDMSFIFISAWQAQIGNQGRSLEMPREQLCCDQRWSPHDLTSQSSMEQWLSTFSNQMPPRLLMNMQWRYPYPTSRVNCNMPVWPTWSGTSTEKAAWNSAGRCQQSRIVYLLGSTPHPPWNREVVTTNGEDALCNHPRDVSSLAQCNQ